MENKLLRSLPRQTRRFKGLYSHAEHTVCCYNRTLASSALEVLQNNICRSTNSKETWAIKPHNLGGGKGKRNVMIFLFFSVVVRCLMLPYPHVHGNPEYLSLTSARSHSKAFLTAYFPHGFGEL